MNKENFERIRMAYVERYRHLRFITNEKVFAENALMLKAPETVSEIDVWNLALMLR